MKLIFRYLKRHWGFALAATLLMMIEVFMDLLLPTIMARIIDEGIAGGNMELVLSLGLRMILVTLIAALGGIGCGTTSSFAASSLGAELRMDLYSKIQRFSYRNLDRLETGNLITRLTSDVTQIENSSRMMLRIMVRAPLQIIGSLVMALLISPSLSLSLAVLIPLLLLSLGMIIKKAYPLYYQLQSRMDNVNTRLQENFLGKRLVKAFVREKFEEEKFAAANNDLVEVTIKAGKTVAFMHPVMQLILNGGIVSALWLGARYIDSGVLKIGQLLAFLNYLRQLLASLMMFSHMLMQFSRALASSKRVEEVLDEPPVIKDNGTPVQHSLNKGTLEFKNVSFSYDGENEESEVLTNISFTIKEGTTAAILGATGSGKTSLVNLVPRFYDITEGNIFIDDRNIKDYGLESLRKSIAVSPQKTTLFAGSIRQNILFHYPEDEQENLDQLMIKSAKTANIHDFISGLPERYETKINQRGVNLSGGQKQRISIARALAKKAAILILDDSTSAVDMTTERKIQEALQLDDATKIIISQRINSVINADTILVLEDGKLNGIGTHSELLESNEIYRDIYTSQTEHPEEQGLVKA
ncbi:ABC transporter ATP-binding protein [Oceanispirochaeta sp. M2]|uniref:ABC transporter ATP-binding protein n=1 Tax=Oceanispirochaeta sp. M2 TaxID=2735869 RepID=UPI0018AC88A6|nr:ABC transporter ATP-binding protein [Oceanispirochaeta sp. M2]MBF9017699.1 ABC transporter ATP-binding protein [Oceanispirochaeta sp. M2]